jgi:cytoskeletal protein CcmA (bactofilin family)
VVVGNIKIDGTIDVKGGLTSLKGISSGEILSVGGLAAEQDVKAKGLINVRGKIEVGGDINCDEFIFKLSSPSYIEGKLTADRIRIEKDENARSECFLRVTEIVSPNRVDIDYVIAERIVAPKVKAGENCRIREGIEKNYDPI